MRPLSEVKSFRDLGYLFLFNPYEGEHCENRKNDVLGLVIEFGCQCGYCRGAIYGSRDDPCTKSNSDW